MNPREQRLREMADKMGRLSDEKLQSDVAVDRSRGHDLAMLRVQLLAEAEHVGALEDANLDRGARVQILKHGCQHCRRLLGDNS